MNKFFSILQKLMEFVFNLTRKCGSVLLFHEVDNEIEKCIDAPKCWIRQNSFCDMICEMQKDFEIVSLDDFFLSKTKKKITLTFDDIYENFYTNAYPFLKEKKIPFTIFIAVNRLDRKPYISTKQLIELSNDDLCTVGSHSMSHAIFRNLTKKQVNTEILESKNKLMKLVKKDIYNFAYPYGSIYASPDKYRKQLKEAKYKRAFSTINSPISYFSSIYYLPRINVNEDNYKKIIKRLR